MPQQASIVVSGSSLLVKLEYNVKMIRQLKAIIPASDRTYDTLQNVWTIQSKWREKVEELLDIHYPEREKSGDVGVRVFGKIRQGGNQG
jgi:hypothetical protein